MAEQRIAEGAVVPQRISVSGRIDVASVADFRRMLHAAVDSGEGPLIVDVSGVELADATGLGLLLGAHRRALRAGRSLVLADPPAPLGRLLARTRLHRVLTLAGTPAP
ncbi:MAG: STAS domain-containing protein [Mycobacteriales bacterium]